MELWRQGDVYFAPADDLPRRTWERTGNVLHQGEVFGHAHRVDDDATFSFAILEPEPDEGSVYLRARTAVRIVHEEHGTISLGPGLYRV